MSYTNTTPNYTKYPSATYQRMAFEDTIDALKELRKIQAKLERVREHEQRSATQKSIDLSKANRYLYGLYEEFANLLLQRDGMFYRAIKDSLSRTTPSPVAHRTTVSSPTDGTVTS